MLQISDHTPELSVVFLTPLFDAISDSYRDSQSSVLIFETRLNGACKFVHGKFNKFNY
jgi:hypothetical protein